MSKRCTQCGQLKKYSEFGNYTGTKKPKAECKRCNSNRAKAWRLKYIEKVDGVSRDRLTKRHNLQYIFRKTYNSMFARAKGTYTTKKSSFNKEIMNSTEFWHWCNREKNFKEFIKIYSVYVQSGYQMKFAPSIDRIDNSKGYELDNIQWLIFYKNAAKK